jgi:hypothetical protein
MLNPSSIALFTETLEQLKNIVLNESQTSNKVHTTPGDTSNQTDDLFADLSDEDDSQLLALWPDFCQQIVVDLKSKVKRLYQIVNTPQIITLKNFSNLKLPTGVTNIEDQITSLFFEARIPTSWKVKLSWTENIDLKPNSKYVVDSVSITMLNYYVKEKTKELLNSYFENHYINTIIVN